MHEGFLLPAEHCLGPRPCLGPCCHPASQPPPPAPEGPKIKFVPREHFAVPMEERPVLGKVGDTTCTIGENQLLLTTDERRCLSLLTDTVKPDSADAGVKVARLRAGLDPSG